MYTQRACLAWVSFPRASLKSLSDSVAPPMIRLTAYVYISHGIRVIRSFNLQPYLNSCSLGLYHHHRPAVPVAHSVGPIILVFVSLSTPYKPSSPLWPCRASLPGLRDIIFWSNIIFGCERDPCRLFFALALPALIVGHSQPGPI
jgi:hypothetical protein